MEVDKFRSLDQNGKKKWWDVVLPNFVIPLLVIANFFSPPSRRLPRNARREQTKWTWLPAYMWCRGRESCTSRSNKWKQVDLLVKIDGSYSELGAVGCGWDKNRYREQSQDQTVLNNPGGGGSQSLMRWAQPPPWAEVCLNWAI